MAVNFLAIHTNDKLPENDSVEVNIRVIKLRVIPKLNEVGQTKKNRNRYYKCS